MGLLLYVTALIQTLKENKENALHTWRAKKAIVHITDSQLALAPIMMGIFQPLIRDSNPFLYFINPKFIL